MKPTLESSLLRELDTLVREIHTIYEAKFKKYKLQKGQFVYLTRICENPGISLVELTKQLKIDKTTTTKAIQKLSNAGYVTKEQDEEDKRVWHLNATSKAHKIYAEIITEKNRVLSVCLDGFNDIETGTLQGFIGRMCDNINIDWQKVIKRTNN